MAGAVCFQRGRQAPTDKITFPEFLTCLLRVAEKVYPSSQSPDDALQQLLMENVLPLASRRHPERVDVYLNSSEIVNLREYFEHALLEVCVCMCDDRGCNVDAQQVAINLVAHRVVCVVPVAVPLLRHRV